MQPPSRSCSCAHTSHAPRAMKSPRVSPSWRDSGLALARQCWHAGCTPHSLQSLWGEDVVHLEAVANRQMVYRGRVAPAASSGHPSTMPLVGEVLTGRFRLLRQLGKGGMGAVFEAFDVVAGVRLAVKVLWPAALDLPEVKAQCRRELLLARAVTHPNVCRLYDLHIHEPKSGRAVPFLTLEFLPGQTLGHRLVRSGPLGLEEGLRVATQLVSGLAAAHSAGVVHRDLKPSNVILVPTGFRNDVRAILTDFGIARARIDAPSAL